MKKPLILLVKAYQKASYFFRMVGMPFFAVTTCKFHPSCSEYAILAINTHGPAKGSFKAIGRVCRCHPWSAGGVDYPK